MYRLLVMSRRPSPFPEEARSLRVDLADVVVRLQKEVEEFWAEWLQKVGDSPSALGLVRVYINAGTHVCGKD